MSTFTYIILIINGLWFSAGLKAFGITAKATARSIRPDLDRDDPKFKLVIPSMRFLGGMNLALAAMNLLALYFLYQKFNLELLQLVLFTSGIAHGTQFAFNIPHIKGTRNDAPWNVLTMPMLFIFVVDFITMAINLIALI